MTAEITSHGVLRSETRPVVPVIRRPVTSCGYCVPSGGVHGERCPQREGR